MQRPNDEDYDMTDVMPERGCQPRPANLERRGGLVRVNAPQSWWRGFFPAAKTVVCQRELLYRLTRKELRVKYKGSALGFVWSFIRPLLLLGVYWLVFGVFLRNPIPFFAFYLFAGLVAWDFFASTVSAATKTIVSNSGLVKKVAFPREVLPLAAVGAGLFHFFVQVCALCAVLLIFRYDFFGVNLALLPMAFLALLAVTVGFSFLVSAGNVYLRDIEHLIEVLLVFWFFVTPIVYSVNDVTQSLGRHSVLGVNLASVYLLNPMANIVMGFQWAFYRVQSVRAPDGHMIAVLYPGGMGSYLIRITITFAVGLALVWFGHRVFAKLQGNFAQEL